MDKSEIDKIKDQVIKTGFPLELRVSEFLRNKGYRVAQNLYYVDEDEDKAREVDIRALLNYRVPVNDTCYFARNCFLIECKKSDSSPWVFLSSQVNAYDPQIPVYAPEQARVLIYGERLFEEYPYKRIELRARTFFEAHKKDSSDVMIIKALTTAVKATMFTIKNKFGAQHGEESLCCYYPLIVFDGTIYNAILKGTEIEVNKVNQVLVSFNYESKAYKDSNFVVPVIAESYLDNYLTEMEQYFDKQGRYYEFLLKATYPERKIGPGGLERGDS